MSAPEFDAVEGLDTADGLRRVGGNAKLYRSLLRQFVEGQADAAEKIVESSAPESARWPSAWPTPSRAWRATSARRRSRRPRRSWRRPSEATAARSGWSALRDRLGGELAGLKAAVGSLLGPEEEERPPETSAPADPAQLKAAVEKLSALLSDSDAAAIDLLEADGAALRALFDAPRPSRGSGNW